MKDFTSDFFGIGHFEETPVDAMSKQLCEAMNLKKASIAVERIGAFLDTVVTPAQVRILSEFGILEYIYTETTGAETIRIQGQKVITFEGVDLSVEDFNLKAVVRFS